ncbi:RNA polymerase sigma factor [Catenuloplanes japonicus]|uniref:RNA polymerase sigma factor n=1 Tax=Catenuloplanes japonicus TaxID=33876 RepID=UPI00052527C4|nr:DUF6596 domain-containing protein [Catenuloplanes japonicus]
MSDGVEGLLRELSPQVLAALVRKFRDFPVCEDALQEALLAAAVQWPVDGVPERPRGWLVTVASRRAVDQIRSERARRDREAADDHEDTSVPGPGEDRPGDRDDTLELLFLCCHPALTPVSQVALTLRAVGGLTTAEVAGAFLVPEATMGVRISRAKQRIRAAGIVAGTPFADRLGAVLHVLYLIFNEGYTASSGPHLQRPDLATEAIRLTRTIHRTLPDDGEVAGLLALMLLTDARRPARTDANGGLIPLAEQDRSLWDHARIHEGTDLVTNAMRHAPLGPYQLQAAIASLHVEAPTDWPQIRFLYRVLCRIAPSPMASLNHAIAVAMTDGPAAGLTMLSALAADPRLSTHHRLASARAHLHELAGDPVSARHGYLRAATLTTSLPERHYLRARAARLTA